jgi:DNA mismatch repair ATPase MutL
MASCRPVGIIHERFFLAETLQGLLLIDVQAVMRHHFVREFLGQGAAVTKPLLIPLTTTLVLRDLPRVTHYFADLQRLGLDLGVLNESAAEGTLILRSIPVLLEIVTLQSFFPALLQVLTKTADPLPFERLIDHIAHVAARNITLVDGIVLAMVEAIVDKQEFSQGYRELSLVELKGLLGQKS